MKPAARSLVLFVLLVGFAVATPGAAVAAPPVMPPDQIVQLGDLYHATVSGVESGDTVDYGDGSEPQALDVTAGSAPLTHLYTSEASFRITVTKPGPESASTYAHVFLPGPLSQGIAFVAPGATGTLVIPGVTATLDVPASNPDGATILTATYAPSNPFFVDAGPTGSVLAGFDVRTVNAVGGKLVVVFSYTDPGDGSVPSLTSLRFFDRATGTFVPVAGSTAVPDSLVVDPVNHTITIVFDGTSLPSVTALTGTRFAVLGSPRIDGLRAKRCVARGAKARLRFSLSQAATVRVRLQRRHSSRQRSRCPRPRRPGRHRKVRLGGGPTSSKALPAGRATIRIPSRGLRPGRYRVTLTAANGAGTSLERRSALVVLRPAG